jgi:DNA invertase Pin-like site-specific DNA recombinase
MKDGISYDRLSDPKQAGGDGQGRQDRAYREFCKAKGLRPAARQFIDYRSGYKDEHRQKGELGRLIAMAKDGKFRKGTVIVVEAWDRLGRLRPDKQTALVAELLGTGVDIGVCKLNDIFTESDLGSHKWTILSTFIMLAYQESKQKAERVREAWLEKKRRARAGEYQKPTETMGANRKAMTSQVPAWIRIVDGAPVLIPEKAKAVKTVFQLAGKGYGVNRMATKLRWDKVPPIVGSGWSVSYLGRLIGDRRVLGEMQPCGPGRKPEGPAIKDYFPAAVTPAEWRAARAGAKSRKHDRGKPSGKVNVFARLIKDARDGGSFFMTARAKRSGHKTSGGLAYVLQNLNSTSGQARCTSFPYYPFETAMLYWLREVSASEVLGAEEQGPNPVDELEGQLAEVRSELAEARKYLKAKGFSAAIADHITSLDSREKEVERELEAARYAAAHPLEEAWKESKGLLEGLAAMGSTGREDARMRLRAVLRRTIEAVYLLVVPRGLDRIAAVQVRFKGNGQTQREYLMWYRPPHTGFGGRRDGRLMSVSIHSPWGIQDPESDMAIGLCPLDMSNPSEDGWRRMELQLSLSDEATEEMFFQNAVTHEVP